MTEIRVIPRLDARSAGPVADGPDGNEQEVHLQQGSLDGACGPYCLFMALLACGLENKHDVTSLGGADGRTALGRLRRAMDDYRPLFVDGTRLGELDALLKNGYKGRAKSVAMAGRGTDVRAFIEHHISEGHPVIVGLDGTEGLAHWVLGVGLEYQRVDDRLQLCRLLVLDPSKPAPQVSAWNGVIDLRGSGGRYPYTWWTYETKVKLGEALAIWPK